MLLSDFLTLVRVIRSLYGAKSARDFFEKNIMKFPALTDIDVKEFKKYIQL